jgi:hypothetical protein
MTWPVAPAALIGLEHALRLDGRAGATRVSLGCYLVVSCQSSMGPVLWCSPDGRGGRDVREMRWPEPPDAPAFLVDHD